MFITYQIEGNPVSQGSFRHIGQGRIIAANPNLNKWRESIAKQIRQQGVISPVEAPCKVELVFTLPRPKTVTRKHPSVKPDLDKLIRACCDSFSLERYVQIIKDDSQIISIKATKQYESTAFKPGVQISIFWGL